MTWGGLIYWTLPYLPHQTGIIPLENLKLSTRQPPPLPLYNKILIIIYLLVDMDYHPCSRFCSSLLDSDSAGLPSWIGKGQWINLSPILMNENSLQILFFSHISTIIPRFFFAISRRIRQFWIIWEQLIIFEKNSPSFCIWHL